MKAAITYQSDYIQGHKSAVTKNDFKEVFTVPLMKA